MRQPVSGGLFCDVVDRRPGCVDYADPRVPGPDPQAVIAINEQAADAFTIKCRFVRRIAELPQRCVVDPPIVEAARQRAEPDGAIAGFGDRQHGDTRDGIVDRHLRHFLRFQIECI